MIKILIPLPPHTKKNSNQIFINKETGKRFITPSALYKQYEINCGWYIKCKHINLNMPLTVKCLYYMPTKRKIDLINLLEATDDILVKYGVLQDDNSQIIVSHDGSRVFYDNEKPRTEIYIDNYKNSL